MRAMRMTQTKMMTAASAFRRAIRTPCQDLSTTQLLILTRTTSSTLLRLRPSLRTTRRELNIKVTLGFAYLCF